ncbi:T9SS type A sorting domain-containing protein [candidate division WOR-3 bacterium]|nr:T9SS type A sorting domain-containing protein [candidate division WOR-3 bacterium]
MKLYFFVLITFTSTSIIKAQESSVFPQDKVDRICLLNREKGVALDTGEGIDHYPAMDRVSFSDKILFSGSRDFNLTFNSRDALYIGPGPDTFLIDTNYVQDGDIIIFGEGVLLVDNAELNLSGHLYAQDLGLAIFRNNAHLHFNQYYVGQYFVWLVDSAKFETTDAIVDANGVMHYAQIHDNCTYIATRTTFPDWTFRKIFDKSTLILEDVYHVGDLMVNDSCFVHFTRCDTLMPWLETPDGSVIDIQFPDPDTVDHFEFSEAVPGVDGIGYTFVVDTCWRCWWSLETWPGCSVIVNNSQIRGSCLRIPGSDTFNVYGIADYNFHPDLTVPLGDRHLEYINTYVFWWNWYPMENTVFNIDSCVFGEMIGRGNSKTYATRCTHDGATISLSVEDTAFVSFVDGVGQAFVSSWDKATLLLVNTSIIPLWPYQSTNIAHGHSYLLAVNSYFEYTPEAMDTALVMVTAIDSPPVGIIDSIIDIYGSAWIDVGPLNSITFDRYRLYWTPDGGSNWTLIEESTSQVIDSILGIWNTSGMSEGEYDLRLTIWDNVGDSLTAFGDMTLMSSGIEKENNLADWELTVHQQGSEIRISLSVPMDREVTLDVFDGTGRKIKNLFKGEAEGRIDIDYTPGSGIYFIRLSGEKTIIEKVVFVR